ncbi:restriction endonuclease subunit S [Bacteroides eggerthii]|mgnify:FL=1|jgi:type I restriction enzyme S subunit|uniref:restriction endonuclease subunit S n=1 Tax=Bacteroides eggerthii TaxID=28111 RepID=UPI001C8CAD25|nr:restriction endonuclease subunit S [Bacteroides eggerthii]
MSAIIEMAYCDRSYHPCRISDVIEQISERNKDKSIDMVLSVSNKQGFINQSEQFDDRIIASEDTSNYKIVHKNDFAYNPARINVGSIARLRTIDMGIVSPMYICFRVRKGVVSEYLEHFFSTSYFFYEMQKRLEGSVRQCLSFEGICNIPIYIPNSEEQHTIGKKISVLLDKIDVETLYHCKLVEQKHYLLRQMFI